MFDHIIDKATTRINSWYTRFLSYAGRGTLIQSVTNAMHAYCMSIAKLPQTIIDKLNSLNKHFLWNAARDGAKRGRVRWSTVCTPKTTGGLGIWDLSTLNTTFQLKQAWWMLQEPESLWAKMYKAKYFPASSFLQATARPHHS